MDQFTIKKYRLTSVGNNLELGKRGGVLKYNLLDNVFEMYHNDKVTLAPLKVGNAEDEQHCATLAQVNELKNSYVSPYNNVNTNQSLEVHRKYYLHDNVVLTLPDVQNVNVGDVIIVRSSSTVTNSSVEVYDSNTDDIITNVGSTTTFSIDIMGQYTFVYAGNNIWEVI